MKDCFNLSKMNNDQDAFQSATRVQVSIITAAEKKALAWFARRMLARVGSDYLTILGFAAQIMVGVGLRPLTLQPATACLGSPLPRFELVWRQARWRACPKPQSAASALRLLCGLGHRCARHNRPLCLFWIVRSHDAVAGNCTARFFPSAFNRGLSRH